MHRQDRARGRKAPSLLQRLIRVRLPGKTGVFGPAFIPSRERHHVSRQPCREYLRGLMFQKVSELYLGLSRRDRRRQARLAAKIEYRKLMLDRTNQVDPEEEAMSARLSQAELKAA